MPEFNSLWAIAIAETCHESESGFLTCPVLSSVQTKLVRFSVFALYHAPFFQHRDINAAS